MSSTERDQPAADRGQYPEPGSLPSSQVRRDAAARLRALAVPGWSYELSASTLAALAVLLEHGAGHQATVTDDDAHARVLDRVARRLLADLCPRPEQH